MRHRSRQPREASATEPSPSLKIAPSRSHRHPVQHGAGGTTGEVRRALVLAILRGALLDLLATGEVERTTAAVRQSLAQLPDRPAS